MTDNVGEILASGGIEGDGDSPLNHRSECNVGEGDALCDEESSFRQMLLDSLESSDVTLEEGSIERFRIGGKDTVEELVDECEVGSNFAINERVPLANESSIFDA